MVSNKEWFLGDEQSDKNLAVLEILKQACPSYAKHMFDGNRVMEAFFKSGKGGINPLDMPICKTCHRPGMGVENPNYKGPSFKFDEVSGQVTKRLNCHCDLHGATYDTKDLRRYLVEDIGINPKTIFMIEVILYGGIEKFIGGKEK